MHTAKCSNEQGDSLFGGDEENMSSVCNAAISMRFGFPPVSPQFHPGLSTGRASLSMSALWVYYLFFSETVQSQSEG